MMLTNWHVYFDLDTQKVGAVDWLSGESPPCKGWKTIGYVAFQHKKEAIQYGEQVLCQF